jgi:cell shape-determining protein MreD
MLAPVLIGSVGVGLLLVAFALNLVRVLKESSTAYLLMNFIGAAMSAWYAWASELVPFVILEGVWALVSLIRLGSKGIKKRPSS